MILPSSFSKEWIDAIRARVGYEKNNPPLVEKMIHALALVEALSLSGLNFIFKGGTSLILLMKTPKRFSIDIDIITTASREEIEKALTKCCSGKPFTAYKLNEKRSYLPGVPKAHYSLMYSSALQGKEDHILLDILLDEHSYPELVEMAVETEWLQTDDVKVSVKVPTHESIAGDKLTAFAPNTTGILYNQGKELEIVKQLHDLGNLYHDIKEITTVQSAFNKTVAKEIAYRGNTCNRENVLDDIIETALLIARRDRYWQEDHIPKYREIQRGLLQFKAYQMAITFRIEDAILAAAKAALMAAKIKTGAKGPNETFPADGNKVDYLITKPDHIYLNKLPAEPLFYWHKTFELLGWSHAKEN